MSLYEITVPQFKNTLTQIEKWLDAAVAHAVRAHGHEDTPELREQISGALKDEVAGALA